MKRLLHIAKIIPSLIQNLSKSIHLLLIVLFVSYCNTTYSQTPDIVPGANKTFTIPANVTSVTASVWGGGGGGGGSSTNGSGGNGGGGGGAISQVFSVVANDTFSYTVGTGGTAGNLAGGTGGNGSSSSATFNPTSTTITATFGTGGRGNAAVLNTPTNSFAGTPTATTAANGTLGGASGGNGGSSGTVVGIFGATATGLANTVGATGNAPGGGGGGGERSPGTSHPGGAGANGQVFFNYISVSGVSPNPVCIGSTITITGTNFSTISTTITVGGVACTSVIRVSATSITAVIGAGTPEGSQNVVITNTNGTNNGQSITVITPSVAPTSISGTTVICNGGSTTLTAVGGTLGTGANYQWGSGSVVGTNPISGETASSLSVSPSSSTTYWVRIENTTSPCTTNTTGITQLVTVNNSSVAPTSISGTTTICNGGSTTLTAVGGTLGSGANYQWGTGSVVGTTPISGQTASTLSVSPSSSTTYWVRIESTTSPCIANTSGVTQLVTVNTPSVAPTSISGTTAICDVGSTTLTAVGGTLGTGANYQWGTGSVVGTNPISGETASTLSVSPSSSTTYWVRIESTTSPCTTNTTGITQLVTVNNSSVAPTSISGTATICNGTSTTLTAVGGTLGTGATYQWGTGSVVGTTPISGQTASTLTVSPSSSTTYWVRIESTTSPCTANTSGVTQLVTVNNPSVAPTSISGTTAICNGGSTTLTAVGGTLGTGANYQWGTGSVVGTNLISGQTASTLTVSPSSSTTYWVRIESTTSPCTANTSGVSQLVTVNSLPSVGAVSANQTICSGNLLSSDITIASATGIIQWERADNAGFTIGLINIGSNATTLTIAEVGVLTATKYFRAVVASGACPSETSGIVTVSVDPTSLVGSVSANQSICIGNSPSSNITIASATGTIQWERADDAVFTSNVITIGTDSTTLTIAEVGVLTETKYFRAVVTSGVCPPITSGTATITVSPLSTVGAIGTNQTICTGNSPSSNITITSATGTIQWQSANDVGFISGLTNIGINSTTLTSVEIGTLTATKYFRAIVTSGVCSSATSGTITIMVDSNPTVGAVSSNQTICSGSNPSSNITLSSATGTIQWQSANDAGFTSGLSNIGTNSTTLTTTEIGTLTATTYFRAIVTNGVCLAVTSGTVSVIVNNLPVGPVIAKNPNDIEVCAGTTLTISVTTAGTGGAVSSQDEYRYDTGSGFTAWSTAIPNFTAVTGTNTIESRRTSTGSGCTTAAGNTVSWTVNDVPVGPIIAKNPNTTAVCAGATLTITSTAGTGGAISSQDEYRFSTDNGANWSAWGTSLPNFTSVAGTNIVESRRTSTGAGCTTAAGNTVSWTVNAVPVGPIIAKNPNATEVCSGTILTITSTAGTGGAISSQDEYRFSTDNGTNWSAWGTSLPSFAAVTGTNTIESRRTSIGSGCTTAAGNTVSWTVNAVPVGPVIAKSPNATAVCAGATLTIIVTTAGTGGAISSQDEYRYNAGSGFTAWSTTIPSFAAVTGTNTIESRRTSSGSGCTTATGNTVSWIVNPLPVAPVISKNPNTTSVCIGASLTITITTAGSGGALSSQDEYRYNAGSGYTAWSTIIPNFTAATGTNIIESRRTSTGSGCTASSINTVSWTVNADPVSGTLTKTPNTTAVCDGTVISAIATAGSSGAGTIVDELEVRLSGGAYSAYISGASINTTGQTSVDIRTRRTATANGCATSSYNIVSWIINPLPTADAGLDRTIFRGNSTILGAAAVGANTYSWISNPAGFTSSISNPTVSPLVNTTYTLTETTPQGCVKTSNMIVSVKDNLVITKLRLSAAPTKPGDIITYQISYQNLNNGGVAAENITITDILPSTAFFTYTSSSPTGTYNAGSNALTYTLASLAAGTSGSITVSGTVGVLGGYSYNATSYYISSGSSTQTINNLASIVNAVTPTITSNVVSDNVTQYCGVNMPATLSGKVHTATSSNLYYFIEVENTGNSTDRFTLTNNIPVQTGDVPLNSLITNMAGDPISQSPWLSPGQKYGFLVQFSTPGGTPPDKYNYTSIKATSTVCPSTSATTYIDTYVYNGPQPKGCDLLISKTVSSSSVVAGANITYTILVRNLRNNDAEDLVIDDILPANLTYISSSQIGADNINYNPTSRLIRVTKAGDYDNGDADIIITITAQTTCASVPSVINSATVVNTVEDDNVLNNVSSVTVTVLPNVSDPATTSSIICSGNTTTISLPSLGASRDYKWYSAATGGTLLQTNGNTYLTPTLTSGTTYYVSQYNTLDSACESNRTAIPITVVSAPVVVAQPFDVTICSTTASFTYNVSGTFLNQQWQLSTNGGASWIDLTNTGVYSGVLTQTLNISNMAGLYGYQYRCNLSSYSCYTLTSTVVSIVSLPTITGTLSVCSGSTTALTGSGTPDPSTPWTSSNLAVATVNNLGVVTGVAAGTSVITYKSSNNCSITATVTVNGLPTISGSLSICNGSSSTLTGSATANATTPWTSASPSIVSINSSGLITALATGSSVITYKNSNGCSTTATVTVNPVPVITIQPVNQLDCEGATVNFEITATGSGLNYTWQRKLPTDVSFSTISAGGNISFPNPNEIRIQNVGSSQSIDGTQYQVIVSNGFCSVVSTIATLSVNAITGLSPISTNVTQCYGTNYSYTVSTTYPANVVSYQWKSSVTSGIWNDVIDGIGTPFSGAQTPTLNIINGTPAESAEYRVYITFTSSGADCNVTSSTRTRKITFLPLLTTPVTTITQPTCSTSTGTITVTVQSASDVYSFDNGITYQGINNVKSGLATGNYNVIIKNSQNCVSPTTIATIDPQPVTPIQPTLSLAALPTCNTLGSFTITNYNASYTYSVSPNIGVSLSGNTVIAPAGNYSVIATLGSCSSISSASINVPSLATNTWTIGGWSTGIPDLNTLVIIDANYNTSTNGDLNACSVTVNLGKTLTITANDYAIIQNNLTVNGIVDVLDKGSLVMINDAGIVTNNGTTTVRRFTSPFERFDYVYWSTPVESTFIPGTFLNWRTNYAFEFLPANFIDANNDSFDDDSNDWSYASTMSPGKGYIVMTPTNKPMYPSVEEIVFSGKVNNGIITAPIELTPSAVDPDDDFNLIGNPYPSAISADAFINANISTNVTPYNTIGGTLYFWTHIGDISNTNGGPDGLNFSTNDYAVYTLAGGVGTSGNIINGVPQNSNKPNGYIASGQGFFVEADNAGTLLFNNAMRVGTETKNNQFYKLQSNKNKVATVAKDRLWLNLQNASNLFSQQLIGYFDNATLGYDKGYDGLFSDAGNYINFYSFIDDNAYKIQGRSSFDENDQVRLGYSSTVTGTFTIGIDSSEGVFVNASQLVLLEDKVTNTIFDLKNGSYTFTTEKGTFNDRFNLRYTNKTLGVDEVINDKNIQILYSSNYKSVIIKNNSDSIINSMSLFNAAGQHITHSKIEDGGQKIIHIPIKNTSSGVYIVKVKTTEGEMTKKIIIQ